MNMRSLCEKLLEQGKGVLHLAPNWVPRAFCRPGRRLRLHPHDYYALGLTRGGIDERWFSSTTRADNGPDTPEDEGLSYAVSEDGKDRVLLLDIVNELGSQVIGTFLYNKYQRWPIYSKFFDNLGPLPHHIHHNDYFAAKVNASGKPEMYFFPSQYNNYGAEFPFTFFGIIPTISKDEVLQALRNFSKGDNRLLELSVAYKLSVDTGWDVPPGILHAPGSLCTYEPQFSSDVYAMYQSVLYHDHIVPEELLWKNTPNSKLGNFDYLMEVIDWEKNTSTNFYEDHHMKPLKSSEEIGIFLDEWICYKSDVVGAKRLTVNPLASMTLKESVPFGLICVQGHGRINDFELSSPSMIRYGSLTSDEYFVTYDAAIKGVKIVNLSKTEPLVILRHFAEHPENPYSTN